MGHALMTLEPPGEGSLQVRGSLQAGTISPRAPLVTVALECQTGNPRKVENECDCNSKAKL